MRLSRLLPIKVKVIDRYLAREFAYSYMICVLIMISLYIILDLFANIDEFMATDKSKQQVAFEIASYYGYHSFLYFSQVAGMVTLIAAALTLTRLQRGNELVAVLAGGISLYRIALPLIVMGLLFNGLWVVNQELIIPRIAEKLVLAHEEAGGKQSFEVGLLKDRSDALLSAATYDPATQTLDQVKIIVRDGEGKMIATISADTAEWDDAKGLWALTRGKYRQFNARAEFDTSALSTQSDLEYYKSSWTPNDLLLRQGVGWTWLLSLRQLNKLLTKPDLLSNKNEVLSARHIRLTQPMINMLLLFLGLPFFLNREPHNVLVSVGFCLLLTILCFMLAFVSQMVAGTTQSPALAAWLPIMVFGPVAAILMENIKT